MSETWYYLERVQNLLRYRTLFHTQLENANASEQNTILTNITEIDKSYFILMTHIHLASQELKKLIIKFITDALFEIDPNLQRLNKEYNTQIEHNKIIDLLTSNHTIDASTNNKALHDINARKYKNKQIIDDIDREILDKTTRINAIDEHNSQASQADSRMEKEKNTLLGQIKEAELLKHITQEKITLTDIECEKLEKKVKDLDAGIKHLLKLKELQAKKISTRHNILEHIKRMINDSEPYNETYTHLEAFKTEADKEYDNYMKTYTNSQRAESQSAEESLKYYKYKQKYLRLKLNNINFK